MADPEADATVTFFCNGEAVEVAVSPGESLLSVLRERLALTSAKDGCAPQGQCGCCTVLVDGAPRVACVTPAERVANRTVTTIEGLDPVARDRFAAALVGAGGTQCGFCTPGIVARCLPLLSRGAAPSRQQVDRALAAHLCRCTGWQGIYDAIDAHGGTDPLVDRGDRRGAEQRAHLESGSSQRVGPSVALGAGGFADDTAPRDALVAVPAPPTLQADAAARVVEAAGLRFVVAPSLDEARLAAHKVQGRRTTMPTDPPLAIGTGRGVRLATSWIEPAYLEPDASWCLPGGVAASAAANAGAFGGKLESIAPRAARELADQLATTVRVVMSREDVVRLAPKRAPIAATASFDDGVVSVRGRAARRVPPIPVLPYRDVRVDASWETVEVAGPPVSHALRAPWAETAVLVEGALQAAGFDREAHTEGVAALVVLDSCVATPEGAFAGARVTIDAASGRLTGVAVRVAAGDPLDEVVLRSYCIGATHMALGWVLTEGIAVDSDTGEVHDLTIRSFGIIRPKDVPPITVTIVDDPRPPIARASDAAFVAVAAACWNALGRPARFPALDTPTSKLLRR